MREADGAMRTGLMVASRIGEQLAKMREQDQRNIAAAEELRASELQERLDAQRGAARAQLAYVGRDDWWDRASSEMIECVHETAMAWKTHDPEAAQAADRISEQVLSRYGIDVNNTSAVDTPVYAALAPGTAARFEAESERTQATAVRADEIVAGAPVVGANRQYQETKGEPAKP